MAAEVNDLVITSDERMLRQIMSNLLSNALNFTPDGGAIAVKAGCEDESLVVQVTDSGIGLSADDLGMIFDEFYQAGGRVGRSKSWTGLGLSLVKKLVGLLGGSIQAECGEQGKGSIFTFTLPLAAGRISSSSPAL
jgi:two-component system phosphate regulon sensor histidine kinase PhoR